MAPTSVNGGSSIGMAVAPGPFVPTVISSAVLSGKAERLKDGRVKVVFTAIDASQGRTETELTLSGSTAKMEGRSVTTIPNTGQEKGGKITYSWTARPYLPAAAVKK